MSLDILSTVPGSSAAGANEPMLPEQVHSGDEPISGNLISSSVARLSLGAVVQGKKDYKLQNVEPFFDDPTGLYYNAFERKLDNLNGRTSEGSLCVEEIGSIAFVVQKWEERHCQRRQNLGQERTVPRRPQGAGEAVMPRPAI